jgi:glycine dehydrogenase subunit 2
MSDVSLKRKVLERTVFELGSPGRRGWRFPALDVPRIDLAAAFGEDNLRARPAELPELSEPEVARHFTRLAEMNHHIDRSIVHDEVQPEGERGRGVASRFHEAAP